MGKKSDLTQEKTIELEAKVTDLEEKWKRALADYQNLEKRAQEEKAQVIKYASEKLIHNLLSSLDNLEKAADHLNDGGLNLALGQLRQVLENEGLVKIKAVGQVFSPEEMEAVEVIRGEEEGKVRKELRPGYKLNGKVIRHAQVLVEKKQVEDKVEELAKAELQKGDYM